MGILLDLYWPLVGLILSQA